MSTEVKDEVTEVAAFAADLRRLRLGSGQPTYEALARRTTLARSTIAEAFSGRRLPSERTVFALVEVLGEDPEEWLARRAAVQSDGDQDAEDSEDYADEPGDQEPPTAGAPDPEREATPREATDGRDPAPGPDHNPTTRFLRAMPRPRGRVSLTTACLSLALALVAGGLAGVLWSATPRALAIPTPSGATGDYPPLTGCMAESSVVASQTGTRETELAIMRSSTCASVWAEVSRDDGETYGNGLRVRLTSNAPEPSVGQQESTGHDSPVLFSPMVVPDDPFEPFCAQAWVIEDGREIPLGEPVCG